LWKYKERRTRVWKYKVVLKHTATVSLWNRKDKKVVNGSKVKECKRKGTVQLDELSDVLFPISVENPTLSTKVDCCKSKFGFHYTGVPINTLSDKLAREIQQPVVVASATKGIVKSLDDPVIIEDKKEEVSEWKHMTMQYPTSFQMMKGLSRVAKNLDYDIHVMEKLWDPGGTQQRLEGKPHFKRSGVSCTGLPWANGPTSRRMSRHRPDKRETGTDGQGIEQINQRLVSFLCSAVRNLLPGTLAACSSILDSLVIPSLNL
jgi:hypothetical protein